MSRRKPARWVRFTRVGLVVLAILLLAMWAFTFPFYGFLTPGDGHSIRIEHGRIEWWYRWDGVKVNEDWGIAVNSEPQKLFLDFHKYPGSMFLKLPIWMLLAPVVAVAAAMFVVPRFRKRPGECRRCGYDRRGLPAGAVCPECGQAEAEPMPVA